MVFIIFYYDACAYYKFVALAGVYSSIDDAMTALSELFPSHQIVSTSILASVKGFDYHAWIASYEFESFTIDHIAHIGPEDGHRVYPK